MRLTSLFILLVIAGCKSNKEVANASDSSPTNNEVEILLKPVLLASIERTACYGKCPMYKATFMDNGQVMYVGRRFVEKIGTYSTLLEPNEIELIKKKAEELKYFELDDLYPTIVSDFPSCITEVQINGNSKRVVNRQNPPQNLKSFEKFLDSLLEGKELQKLSDETNYQNSNY